MSKNVMISVYENNCMYYFLEEAEEFLKFFTEKINLIPPEFMDTAQIEIEPNMDYDSPVMDLNIYYMRPETEKEISEKEQRENEQKELQKERDIKLIIELKKKHNL